MRSFPIRALLVAGAALLSTPAKAVTTFMGQPTGMLFFGPYVGVETGSQKSIALRARLENLGLTALDEYDSDETLLLGGGINAGIRHYFSGGQRGAFLGYGGEISATLWNGPDVQGGKRATTWEAYQEASDGKNFLDISLVIYVDGGYRWILDSGLVLTAAMATLEILPVVVSENESGKAQLIPIMPVGEVGFVF